MLKIYLLQAGQQGSGLTFNQHLIVLGLIILLAGILGGYTGYLIEKNKYIVRGRQALESYKEEIRKKLVYFLVTGCSAALLIPLFLSTISSQLMSEAQKDPLKYFVFGGFCLLVAVFSKQFISTLSEKLIKDLKEEVTNEATQKAEEFVKEKTENITQQVEEQVTKQTSQLQEKISALAIWDDLARLENQIKRDTDPKILKLEDLESILDKAFQTEDPKLPVQVYDKISVLCYNHNSDLLEKINEKYRDKIDLTPYSWADLAVVFMNKYSQQPKNIFKEKSEKYLEEAIQRDETYGTSYAIKIYLRIIELNNMTSDNPRKKEVEDSIKDIFKQITNLGKLTSQEASNYFHLNDKTTFSKFNEMLKEKFPAEWKKLEEDGKK